MPEIAPFRAYYYNVKNRAELESLVAPPHDIISPAEKNFFFKRNPDNIVRIILPDSYQKAAQILNIWIRNKRLLQHPSPALYLYETKFHYNNQELTRYGLVALVKLTEFSEKQIIPHEKTFEKVTEGRLNLFRATNANFNPIFFIFKGPNGYSHILQKYLALKPFLMARDSEGVEHALYLIDSPQDIAEIQNYFKNIPLVIADGHHRYSSALAYSRQGGSKYVLGLLVDIKNPGLLVFPTHRLIRYIPTLRPSQILEKVQRYFDVASFPFTRTDLNEKLRYLLSQMKIKSRNAFGVLFYNGSTFYVICLKKEISPASLIQKNYSDAWKRLDVSILHEFLFNRLLKIPQEFDDTENIIYTKNLKEAIKTVQLGLYQALFILNPTKVEDIIAITSNSEIMPHKSTYFYPKPLSGLLIYKWD